MKEIVFFNGKFLSTAEAKPPLLGAGFLSGWGLFETMRAYRQGIVYLPQHLKRIKASCRLIQMGHPWTPEKIKEIIRKAVKMSGLTDAYVRLTLAKATSGTDTLILVKRYRPYPPERYRQGLRAGLCRLRQDEHSFLARIKTTSRIFYELAYLQAKNGGFDEALILNRRGDIAECSRSNLFLVKGGRVFTPALECGCLDGITRKAVFALAKRQGIRINTGSFTVDELLRADEAFLTNSLIGIIPLTYLEGRIIGKGRCAKLTQFLIEKYNSLLSSAGRS